MQFINPIIIFFLILFFFHALGFFSLQYIKKQNVIFKTDNTYICSIIGLSIFSIIITILYNIFNLKLIEINIFFLFFFIILFLLNFRKLGLLILSFKKVLFYISPIIFFLLFIVLFKDENFYVFRGNYWDQFTMLSIGLIFEDNRYSEINQLLQSESFDLKNFINFYNNIETNNFSKDHYYFSFHNIYGRQFNSLLLSFFFIIKFLNLFQINLVIKLFFFTNIIIANIYFFRNMFNQSLKYSLFYSWLFILSFWSIYIFEIDALAQLCSFSLFIFLLTFSKKIIFDNLISNQNIILFLVIYSSLFLIYPTLFIFFNFILFFLLLFKYNFVIKNYKKILIFISFFLVIVSPRLLDYFKLIFHYGSGSPDYWMYFGGFILGRDSIINDPGLLAQLKLDFLSTISFKEKIKLIMDYHFSNKYIFILFNIPVSLFGFYHLTPGVFDFSISQLSLLFLSIILTFIVLINVFKNLKFLFINKKKFIFEIITIFSIFVFSLFLMITLKLYALIKVYFFISPILFVLFITNLSNKFSFRNLIIFAALISLPLYKYSANNFGTGRIDSMPSILDQNKKINSAWRIDKKDLNKMKKCKNVSIKVNDIIERSFISLTLDFYDIIESKKKKTDCIILKKNRIFKLTG